eukprot:TRINITY_DN14810_c0_g1_i2.p1 TRINITY_DN14810_c0_g1~~TRINITY_DN14810_c0_g1_i2.p1  ORF type:complete len:320 (-),score=-4.36 TRINITY_DN14810_c0_g1_i2:197-1156(-)
MALRDPGLTLSMLNPLAILEEESTDRWWNQKIATARTYLFYLTFENSRWPDYVTEKLYHVLTAGSVPIVIGAPNIADFVPSPDSYLYLNSMEDVPAVVQRMKFLMQNQSAYEAMLDWKHHEAPNSFKAIADISSVHHTCRLCIHVATRLEAQEDNWKRPGTKSNAFLEMIRTGAPGSDYSAIRSTVQTLHCTCPVGVVRPPSSWFYPSSWFGIANEVHRLYVRENGRFHYRSVLLLDLTVQALYAAVQAIFRKDKYKPTWVEKRQELGITWTRWNVYRIYPVGTLLRDALKGNGSFTSDSQFQEFVKAHPCPKLEVILV